MKSSNINLTYISTYDSKDVHNWSGLGYFISKALENEGVNIGYMGNLSTPKTILDKIKKLAYRSVGKRYLWDRTNTLMDSYAEQINSRLKDFENTDIFFSPGTLPISKFKHNKPLVTYTDATFGGMVGYYDTFRKLAKSSIDGGNRIEKLALANVDLAIYSSDWAANSAIDIYGINPNKVKVVPFGANIEEPIGYPYLRNAIDDKQMDRCELLFIGVDWKRKGGDIALDIVENLNQRGISARLHVVGIPILPKNVYSKYIVNHGFLSKASEQDKRKIEELMLKCHFFLLPTQAEAYGLVFCEANAYGLPSLANNTGGISTIIKNGVNGFMVEKMNDVDEYCTFIESYFQDVAKYQSLCISSYNEYRDRLNWEVSGKKIYDYCKDLL